MKTIVQLTLVFIFSVLATSSFAQALGLKGGLNLANMLAEDASYTYSDEYDNILSFTFGPTMEISIIDNLVIESGFQVTSKGYKYTDDYNGKQKESMHLYFLEIPLQAKGIYHFDDFGLYGMFGPYLGIGIMGKYKSKSYDGSGNLYRDYNKKINWGKGEDYDLRRGEMGINIGGGIILQRLQIGLWYSAGLTNISPIKSYNSVIKNRLFGLVVGYRIGEMK